MKIGKKLAFGFGAIILIIGVTSYFAISVSQKALERSIGNSSVLLARNILDKIDRHLYYRITDMEEFFSESAVVDAVILANGEYSKLSDIDKYIEEQDKEWARQPKGAVTPFMKRLINNKLSERLREKIKFYKKKSNYPVYGELFVTNKYGANIAQTDKTSDYYQADEAWWREAKQKGLYLGNVSYDESSGVYSTDIGMSIKDKDGNFVGVAKAVLNIEGTIDIIKEAKSGNSLQKTMELRLLTSDGKIIYSTDEFTPFAPVSGYLRDKLNAAGQEDYPGYFIGEGNTPTEGRELFGYALSGGYKDYKGLGWIFIVEYKTKEIFAPVARLKARLSILLVGMALCAIFIGLFISRAISRAVVKLMKASREIGKGNLNTRVEFKSDDEFGLLASSFNKMAEELRVSTTSIGKLNEEIAQRRQLETALRESEEKIRALFDQTFQFIGLMTPEGVLIEANRSALEFAGVEASSVLNKPFWETVWWAHSPELQEKLRLAVKNAARGEFVRFEATHCDKNKRLHYVDFSLKPVKNANDKVIFLIPEGRDITERKESEEQLRKAYIKVREMQEQLIQAEKLNAVGILASGVAHEVRNPLAIIVQSAHYLGQKISGKEKDVTEALKMLQESVERTDKIVSELLDFSRASHLKLEALGINAILESSLELIKGQPVFKDIEIVRQMNPGIPEALVDKNKIEQVFINILLNAAQASSPGGKIFVRTYDKELDEPQECVGNRAGDHFRKRERAVIVEVEDSGVGISEQDLKKIFDPFFTTKGPQGGAGLGLSVSRNIVYMHKGLICAQSRLGQGTKISVILKIARR